MDQGGPLLASAVWLGPAGEVEVGRAARERAPERPFDTVLSVKRLMGRGRADLSGQERALLRLAGQGDPLRLAVAGGARAVTPVEVSARSCGCSAATRRRRWAGRPARA
ncbi:MAG: hypothetical protein QM767_27275 [Anaeromyxobacter sp.]